MQNSTIEWTNHTFNPWWGCQRVSPGCEHCYAETLAKRYGHAVWGPAKTTERRMMSENYWKQPLKWDRLAQVSGRKRVFCASMADVFEDHPQLIDARARLMCLIDETPNLDWLLLTKRPENILDMIDSDFPANVWIGTSCEDQQRADERIPHLLRVPARVRFLSCEPLLGAIDLRRWLPDLSTPIDNSLYDGDAPVGLYDRDADAWFPDPADIGLHWIICGGESGPGARPMHPDWARSLRDQCQAAGVSYFFKQWGQWVAPDQVAPDALEAATDCGLRTPPTYSFADGLRCSTTVWGLGKHAAGRLLDGVEHNEMPS